jgi:hypothetical protein
MDVLRRVEDEWVIDFGTEMPLEKASSYEAPFAYAVENVYPVRKDNRRALRRERWWIHSDPQPSMRASINSLNRYVATVRVAKHRIFVWLSKDVLCSNKLIVIAREDDYLFGVLHSRLHEVWSLANSSRHGVGNDPAYTPTTTFETYPFPWPPGREPGEADDPRVAAIARAARALVAWRDAWLNPPPPDKGTLDVAYERLIKARTLTNLYNGLVYFRATSRNRVFAKNPVSTTPFDRAEFDKQTRRSVSPAEIQELDDLHHALDAAVFRAYGWTDADGRPETLSDEAILERLLALNRERAASDE